MSPSPPPEKKPEKRKPGRPPGRPAGSKKQPIQIQPVDLQLENDGTLYGAIRNGRVALQVKYFNFYIVSIPDCMYIWCSIVLTIFRF